MTHRETDAEVAEKVMGWHRIGGNYFDQYGFPQGVMGFYPSFSSADAFMVVEKFDDWITGKVIENGKAKYWCTIVNETDGAGGSAFIDAEADTLPMAICLAALAAIEKEKR